MRYCVKCGRQVEDSMNFCPSCGAQIPKEETHHTYEYGNGQYTQNQTEQRNFREQTVKEEGTDRVLAVLAYLGLLVFVPILSGSKSEFVRFHANQGLVLFICSVLWNALDWILSRFVWFMDVGIISLGDLLGIVNLALVVLAIIGIVNACKRKKEELPFIGNIVLFQ